jgi:hypothetical protein
VTPTYISLLVYSLYFYQELMQQARQAILEYMTAMHLVELLSWRNTFCFILPILDRIVE